MSLPAWIELGACIVALCAQPCQRIGRERQGWRLIDSRRWNGNVN